MEDEPRLQRNKEVESYARKYERLDDLRPSTGLDRLFTQRSTSLGRWSKKQTQRSLASPNDLFQSQSK